jgi:hypothetical protein
MANERFPRPYVDSVPKDPENVAQMEYVKFPTMDIGARPSGLPKGSVNDIKSLEHVGDNATKGR